MNLVIQLDGRPSFTSTIIIQCMVFHAEAGTLTGSHSVDEPVLAQVDREGVETGSVRELDCDSQVGGSGHGQQ
jgi:hypothetical protein